MIVKLRPGSITPIIEGSVWQSYDFINSKWELITNFWSKRRPVIPMYFADKILREKIIDEFSLKSTIYMYESNMALGALRTIR